MVVHDMRAVLHGVPWVLGTAALKQPPFQTYHCLSTGDPFG